MTTLVPNKPIQWARLLMCGLMVGFVWSALSIALHVVIGDEFLVAISAGRFNAKTLDSGTHPILFLINHLCGIWAMWFFVLVRPRFTARWKAAMAAGVGWWAMASLQSFKWWTLTGLSFSSVAFPFAATLPSMIVAVFVGAWFYEK